MRRIALLTFLISCMCSLNLWSQNVSSAVQGTVVDSTNAVVVGAQVLVVNQSTATERNVVTSEKGLFRVPQLQPGTYKVTIKAQGFKAYTQKDVVLVGSETRDLGNVKLDIGSNSEQVVVSAEVTPVQTSSSEKASTIDPEEMRNQTVRGRDMVAYMDMTPGLVDTGGADKAGGNPDRNVSSTEALTGISLNGADAWHINFTVDGVPVMDNTNEKLHYEPNVDSIQELKVMSSSYQAEFGRNSGGTITIITKGGSSKFHGSGWYAHKHEQFNANTWGNNNYASKSDRVALTKNRSNVGGWSLGGPVYIPGKFNTQKNKIFFFASQEYTRQLVPTSSGNYQRTLPTEAELSGDFSATAINPSTGAGTALYYYDGTSRTAITGCEAGHSTVSGTCVIPSNLKSTVGQGVLNWFRSVRNSDYDKSYAETNSYQYNWESPAISGSHPRRNDMIRIDANVTSNLSAYFRWIRDTDTQVKHQNAGPLDVFPTEDENPGHGYLGNATWTINPSTVNELSVAFDATQDNWFSTKASDALTSVLNLPTLYSSSVTQATPDMMPDVFFSSNISNGPMEMGGGGCSSAPCSPANFKPFRWGMYESQHYWTINDNLSKTIKTHNLKAGLYTEIQHKVKPGSQYYNGEYAFGSDGQSNNYDSNNGYANAYMGYFSAFQQTSNRTVSYVDYSNVEWYVQDNWRAASRLTIDAGVRFYHFVPYHDNNHSTSIFLADTFDYNKIPAFNSDGTLTCTGGGSDCDATSASKRYYDNGMHIADQDGISKNTYSTKWLAVAPRLGFALDLFGNGKTAVRGGFGLFYNRESGQLYDAGSSTNMAGQVPVLQSASLTWGSIDSLSGMASTNPVSPISLTSWVGKSNLSYALNSTFGIQQNLGHNFVLDVSYVGAWAQNQPESFNINTVPLWTCWNCQSSGAGTVATRTESSTNYNLWRPYTGYSDIYLQRFDLYNNYHSLQSTLQRRFSNGLMVGVSYTLSKQLTLGSMDPVLSATENRTRNYGGGPAASNLMINYTYELPKLSKKLGDNVSAKAVGAITDNWALSGITHLASGSAYTVTCGYGGQQRFDQTGTPSEGTTCDLISDPHSGRGKMKFNPNAYTIAAWHTLGNAPKNNLVGPGMNNWDMTVRRSIPLGAESRRKIQLEVAAYNVFNHPQFTGVNSGLSFLCGDENGTIVDNQCTSSWVMSSSTSTTGKPESSHGGAVGVYGTDTQQARMLGFNARIEF
jgi:hypothetical protein